MGRTPDLKKEARGQSPEGRKNQTIGGKPDGKLIFGSNNQNREKTDRRKGGTMARRGLRELAIEKTDLSPYAGFSYRQNKHRGKNIEWQER